LLTTHNPRWLPPIAVAIVVAILISTAFAAAPLRAPILIALPVFAILAIFLHLASTVATVSARIIPFLSHGRRWLCQRHYRKNRSR
jgi:hypothetical protein